MTAHVRHGFVLVEAVVALLVVGLVAAAAVELLGADLRAARREPALLTASALAQDRMAGLLLLDDEALERLPDSLAAGRYPAPFTAYAWRSTVQRASDEKLYDVHVQVYWSGGSVVLDSRASGSRPERSR